MANSKQCNISFKDGTFPAYHAYPENAEEGVKHPALVLIHEVWGLTDHIKDVAERFADQGLSVLAPDLLSHTGIMEKIDEKILEEVQNPETRDEAQKKMRSALALINAPEFGVETLERLKECVSFLLANENVSKNIGVLGFCFGGSYSYQLAAADARVKVSVPFYGHAPEPLDLLETVSCPIYAFYGEEDPDLMEQLPKVKAKMEELGKDYEATTYPGAKHAFFNDTNPTTYNKEAAEDAWEKILPILHEHLGTF